MMRKCSIHAKKGEPMNEKEKTVRPKGTDLKNIPTCQLVQELTGRDGAERMDVEPYKEESIFVKGPAIIFVVVD